MSIYFLKKIQTGALPRAPKGVFNAGTPRTPERGFQRGDTPHPRKGLYKIKLFFFHARRRVLGQGCDCKTSLCEVCRGLYETSRTNPAVKVATAPFKTPSQGEGFATAHNLPLRTPSKKGVANLGGLLSNDRAFRYWWRLADPSGGSAYYAVRRNKKIYG